MNFIEYCFNWGTSLARSEYKLINGMLLIFGLIGAIFAFVKYVNWIKKILTKRRNKDEGALT